jgi:hypothetical protein
VQNRRTAKLFEAAAAGGTMPLDYMLDVLRDDEADARERAWAAEKAAPYLYSKPAPEPRVIELELPETETLEGMNAAAGKIMQAAAVGTIAPAEAQSLMSVIESQRRLIETIELKQRLEALEAAAESKARR